MRQYMNKIFNTVFSFVFNHKVSYYKIIHYQNSCKILTKYASSPLCPYTRVPLYPRFILALYHPVIFLNTFLLILLVLFNICFYQLISVIWRHDSPTFGLFHVFALYHFIGSVPLNLVVGRILAFLYTSLMLC